MKNVILLLTAILLLGGTLNAQTIIQNIRGGSHRCPNPETPSFCKHNCTGFRPCDGYYQQ